MINNRANLSFKENMGWLTKELREQFKEGKKLEKEIKINLKKVGWRIF